MNNYNYWFKTVFIVYMITIIVETVLQSLNSGNYYKFVECLQWCGSRDSKLAFHKCFRKYSCLCLGQHCQKSKVFPFLWRSCAHIYIIIMSTRTIAFLFAYLKDANLYLFNYLFSWFIINKVSKIINNLPMKNIYSREKKQSSKKLILALVSIICSCMLKIATKVIKPN